jgi:hypothetical protein
VGAREISDHYPLELTLCVPAVGGGGGGVDNFSCTDGRRNGAEAGVDCGGQCSHACGTVAVRVTLSMPLSAIPVGSSARSVFEASFKADVAQMLNVSVARVAVTGITAGSVVVEFSVLPATGLSHGPSVSAAQTEMALLGSMPGSTTLAGHSVSAVSAQLIGGVAPLGSTHDCGRPVCPPGPGGIGATANSSSSVRTAGSSSLGSADGGDTATTGAKVAGVVAVGLLLLAVIAFCVVRRKKTPPWPTGVSPSESAGMLGEK